MLLCVCVAPIARADCGSWTLSASRFRAKVLAVKPLKSSGLTLLTVVEGGEPRYAVSAEVQSVQSDDTPVKAGETWHFAVHSVTGSFGRRNPAGSTVNLEADWFICQDGVRRLMSLDPLPTLSEIEEFDGWPQVGHRYRTKVRWTSEYGLETVRPLTAPHHHDSGVSWINADDYPQLQREGTERTIVFELVSIDISHLAEWHWLSIYHFRVLDAG